jgi:deoxyadenosine/deoxycytidine kinase
MTGKEGEPLAGQIRVGIVGILGSGKSTVACGLSAGVGIPRIEEQYPDNPFLPLFYEDPRRFSYKSQTWFLIQKIRQLASLDGSGIIDPDDEMDECFAEAQFRMGFMSQGERELYRSQRKILREVSQIPPTDMFVWTDAPVAILKDRIRKRGRPYELLMLRKFPSYLAVLQETLGEWVDRTKGQRIVVRVDTANNDIVTCKAGVDFLKQSVINLLVQKVK